MNESFSPKPTPKEKTLQNLAEVKIIILQEMGVADTEKIEVDELFIETAAKILTEKKFPNANQLAQDLFGESKE